ncbi:MAG: PGPGW domain-containing protein [Acidobacteriota bacterium]
MLKIVAGFALLPIGVVMLPLPGPGWLVIFMALAILAGEYVWAQTLMDRLKQFVVRLDPRKRSRSTPHPADSTSTPPAATP